MNINTLTEREDPMGAAIRDYFRQGKSAQLKVLSSLFDDDEMPVAHLFRSYHEMPAFGAACAQRSPRKSA